MILAEITLGAPQWLGTTGLVCVVALLLVLWSYARGGRAPGVRTVCGLLKWLGVVALLACLVEPLWTSTRPQPGSNLFLVVADNSRSLQIADGAGQSPRSERLRALLRDDATWLTRLGQDFDVRRFTFDSLVQSVNSFSELTWEGDESAQGQALATLAERFRDRPVAGILLLSDGNATDALTDRPRDQFPPVYPVPIGVDGGVVDLSLTRVEVTQTNFEAAPVTLAASVEGVGLEGRDTGLLVRDAAGLEVERRLIGRLATGETRVERFLLRPEHSGISSYTVHAFLKGEEALIEHPGPSSEATLANNRRLVTVDRGGGPFRVLYVAGRPGWEFKFMRRALDQDDDVQLVALIRIARREPKFSFLGRPGERTNPLFRGFDPQQAEQAEQYDQPVLVRLGTQDREELRGGFPQAAEDLFGYHAIILDDVEAAFFSQDQLSLMQQFVSRRGGGLLMLGGVESFAEGGYGRNVVGEMLPVYLDRRTAEPDPAESPESYRLHLTREGWLQPWVRLRANEPEEESRLEGMPQFNTVNRIDAIKPGASVLAEVTSSTGKIRPALVVQPFGRGRAAALLIGDLWRWQMRRPDPATSDLERSWRQMLRWLVSDVPARIQVETSLPTTGGSASRRILVRARDQRFEPLDNATVTVRIKTPDQQTIDLPLSASEEGVGQYVGTFRPRIPGAYRGMVTVAAADGSPAGQREFGWGTDLQTEEFRRLTVDRAGLERLAHDTGGEIVEPDALDDFVSSLTHRQVPILETTTHPLWHRWPVFLIAILCLVGEWGLRRWIGLP
ncbi:MAG: glutamine amidotransferase [Planctomycetales bacterium]